MQKIKDHNQQLRDQIFAMDEHIKTMNEQLEVLESTDVTVETLQADLMKPKNEVDERLIKCQLKNDVLQDVLFGLKSCEELESLDQWLMKIRKVSNKQFKWLHRVKKIEQYKAEQGL